MEQINMNQRTYLKVVSVVFLVVAVMHLLRLLMSWSMVFNGYAIPVWASVLGGVVALYLAYQAYRLSR